MAWTNEKGFNFRSSLGFVTDGANQKFIDATFVYPTSVTIDGDTFNCGFSTSLSSGRFADVDNGVDARLAGAVFQGSGDPGVYFQVELPTIGSYEFRAAFGTALYTAEIVGSISDTATDFATIAGTLSSGQLLDASDAVRANAAAWVSSNVAVTRAMTTTLVRVNLGVPTADNNPLTHFSVKQLGGGELALVAASPIALACSLSITGDIQISAGDAQFCAPTSDVTVGSWSPTSGTSLYAMLDETTPSDVDYIRTGTPADTCTVGLAAATDPAVSTGHVVSYRIQGNGTSGLTVSLRQGATLIASWTHDPAPTDWTTYAQLLTAGEADAITDYAALRLQFTEV